MSAELEVLVNKLNPICRRALQKAAESCVSQTHYNVEVEHLLLQLMDVPDTDLKAIFQHYEVELTSIQNQLTRSMEEFNRGNSRTPAMSPQLVSLLAEAWKYTSIQLQQEQVRSGAIMVGVLNSPAVRGMIIDSAPGFLKFSLTDLKENCQSIITGTAEDNLPGAKTAAKGDGKQPFLDQYTVDITKKVKNKELDRIEGRDREIRQLIDILCRRRQNNPILTGDAGVGKTAVVEGFAWKVVEGDVPPELAKVSVKTLDLGLLQAGAGVKGEFEHRLKSVIEEVKQSAHPIILFIDEAHTLIGAGGEAGQGDAANLLKPALARGDLRTIAATTWSEYKRYFEKDPALARRFQVVKVGEPDRDTAINMLRVVEESLSKHHKVRILDEAIVDAVKLSQRYITGRKLPDKAISLLDTACARVAIGQTTPPVEMEEAKREKSRLDKEIEILLNETFGATKHQERLEELNAKLAEQEERLEALDKRWDEEKSIVEAIIKLESDKESIPADTLQEKMTELEEKLEAIQGKEPMVHVDVDAEIVASVVADWTGIPVSRMVTDEIEAVLKLQERMAERLIGQSEALKEICSRIRTSRAKLDDPNKPAGVFLLVGPSGVGKTETALTLSNLLYGGERNLITINMSEYQEAHTVSSLKGAPPGYVGYGKGGVLTEAVRQQPFSVVLLDEVEKAHPDVLELFYQVFDKGVLEDGEGVVVDFKNTMILLTSNVATDTITNVCRNCSTVPDLETLTKTIKPELLEKFKPAFLGRLVTIPYYPLEDHEIQQIAKLKLNKIKDRFEENNKAEFEYEPAIVESIAARCTEVDSGARNVDNILTGNLLPQLSEQLLLKQVKEEPFSRLIVRLDENDEFLFEFVE